MPFATNSVNIKIAKQNQVPFNKSSFQQAYTSKKCRKIYFPTGIILYLVKNTFKMQSQQKQRDLIPPQATLS